MSSLIAVNSNEGESILPEVEELSEFHPDQLSSLVDIQEELEKLEASENVGVEEVMSISTIDDVNVVDHEVTIVAEQCNEDMTILPEINEISRPNQECANNKTLMKESCNSVMVESFDIGETITIGNPSLCETRGFNQLNSSNTESNKNSSASVSSSVSVIGQSTVMSQLKAIRPLPEPLKGKKPIITMAHPPKNVLTKVILSSNNQHTPDAPIILGEAGGQTTIRIVGQNKAVITNSPKTITLAQAKEMGLFSPGKVQHFLPNQPKGTIKKGVMMNSNKALTVVKSSPTKILPLPATSQLHPIAPSPTISTLPATSHKIFIRQSPSTIKSASFPSTILASSSAGHQGQILQIPVSQDNHNNQIHQIQLPGKSVQYVRLVNTVTTSVTAPSNPLPMETQSRPEPMMFTSGSADTQRPVPVALTTSFNAPQLKMVPIAPAQTLPSPVPQQNSNSFERVLVSPGLNQLSARPDAKPPASNIVMVPAEYVKQYKPLPINQSPPSPPNPVSSNNVNVLPLAAPPPLLTKAKEANNKETVTTTPSTQRSKSSTEPPNGIRPRKPCNCTKSQCLKLYCDCFANGEFCFQCNCNSCFNNLDHEEERQKAIKSCLERNPNAFRPKIGKGYIGDERKHNKGCNCKRSGCLKNYCECYEAKISCSNNCKCVGCRNVEEAKDRTSGEGGKTSHQAALKNKLSSELEESAYKPHNFLSNQGVRQPFNLMTHEVVEATCQCLLAQVEGDNQLTEHVERLILEEFGRCLVAIIDCATRTTVNNQT